MMLEGADTFTLLNPEGVECTCSYRQGDPPYKACRCHCPKCGSRNVRWEAWGSYLDKDLVCQRCKYTVDIWDC